MAITYDDFWAIVEEKDRPFVKEMNDIFLENGCKTEIRQASQGYVVTYLYMKDDKKVSVMNYVFRKKGMLARIYAKHIAMYQDMLNTLPDSMKAAILKGGDCKRLHQINQCCPTCSAGFDFMMDDVNYKKCRNSAFFWEIIPENRSYIKSMIQNELKFSEIDR